MPDPRERRQTMFPYKDENPTLRTPVVTVALIAANVAAWLLLQGMGQSPILEQSVCQLGLVPGHLLGAIPAGTRVRLGPDEYCRIGHLSAWATVFTSMFMHGGWLHLIGNMWFLWIFGNNVEDSSGRIRFLVFYLACGAIAAAAQSLANPDSPIPMVGASGAISGIMGAYIVLYPRVRVHMLVVLGFYIGKIAVPAYLMLGYWLLIQLVSGALAVGQESGGVAFLAHAGGFVAGMALIFLFRDRGLVAQHRAYTLQHETSGVRLP
jgi:membrane associated rhomboid family serine protease